MIELLDKQKKVNMKKMFEKETGKKLFFISIHNGKKTIELTTEARQRMYLEWLEKKVQEGL